MLNPLLIAAQLPFHWILYESMWQVRCILSTRKCLGHMLCRHSSECDDLGKNLHAVSGDRSRNTGLCVPLLTLTCSAACCLACRGTCSAAASLKIMSPVFPFETSLTNLVSKAGWSGYFVPDVLKLQHWPIAQRMGIHEDESVHLALASLQVWCGRL